CAFYRHESLSRLPFLPSTTLFRSGGVSSPLPHIPPSRFGPSSWYPCSIDPGVKRQPRSSPKNRAARSSSFTCQVTYTMSPGSVRSEEHTSELQSRETLVCRLLLIK